MKKVLLAALLAGMALWTGCDGTEPPKGATITITFKALYDGQPLEKYKNYDYDTYQVQFSRFNAFMADFALLDGNNAIKFGDIAWVDFTPDLAPSNMAVEVPVVFTNVPDGDYTGIRLGYGVPPALNAKQPKDFSAGHPLSRENEYWLGWGSYIFNKIEGQVDLDKNGSYDGSLIYHCGSNAVYRTYDFNVPLKIEPGANITVEFDLKKLFVLNGAWLDLTDTYNHITSNDANDVVIATQLMDNFGNATTVK
ncbi:MAG: hypothetical protein IPH12_12265 [Saprospirales bacterium]|jgi:hypothetical protein|nr:hypothetical protein [Saprospirales bacterium]MBK8921140.1 hypothetical protein [Saprospirales bacterium]